MKALSVSELNLLVKKNVASLENGSGYCSAFGDFDLLVAFKGGGGFRIIECSDGLKSNLTIMDVVGFEKNTKWSCFYSKLNAADKKRFVELLKSKKFEECVSTDGYYFIQEAGADKESIEAHGTMVIDTRTEIVLV